MLHGGVAYLWRRSNSASEFEPLIYHSSKRWIFPSPTVMSTLHRWTMSSHSTTISTSAIQTTLRFFLYLAKPSLWTAEASFLQKTTPTRPERSVSTNPFESVSMTCATLNASTASDCHLIPHSPATADRTCTQHEAVPQSTRYLSKIDGAVIVAHSGSYTLY